MTSGPVSHDALAQRAGKILASIPSGFLAVSGGIDSQVLLILASKFVSGRIVAVTETSLLHPRDEVERVRAFCRQWGVEHQSLDLQPLTVEAIARNRQDRCRQCKSNLFSHLVQLAQTMGLACVMDGTNADDLSSDRPGLPVLRDLGVVSPLAAAGLTKLEIRQIARGLGVPDWDRPSQSCLATRFPFGTSLTAAGLSLVGLAEEALRNMGFRSVRVRFLGGMGVVEVSAEEHEHLWDPQVRSRIDDTLIGMGFVQVALSTTPYRSGRFDHIQLS